MLNFVLEGEHLVAADSGTPGAADNVEPER